MDKDYGACMCKNYMTCMNGLCLHNRVCLRMYGRLLDRAIGKGQDDQAITATQW